MSLSKESGNAIFPGTCSTTVARERFKIIAENKIVDPVPEPPILSSSIREWSFSCHWYEHARKRVLYSLIRLEGKEQ